ncbi:MAG: class I SAM-dependent methyltransferase [Planctomycetes bacterium]|nr:class I SAM-dependent methyltransferase [Planctomycetota bacterium]
MASEPGQGGSTERAAAFWAGRHALPDAGAHDNFLSHPLLQAYVSLRAFGNLTGHLDAVIGEIRDRTRPGARVFSPGCGNAAKEVAMARALPDRHFVACDITPSVLDAARAEAERQGVRNLTLEFGDFNRLELAPASFDIVTGLGSIHHVEALEGFWSQVRRALRPGGVVLAQEYVGASRFQWPDAQIEAASRALRDLVPERHKPHHREVHRIPVGFMLAHDPSEAVRSAEILSTCRAAGFAIDGYASAGGGLLQPVLMHQIDTYEPRNWEHNLVLATLFHEEDRLMRAGVLGDDFAMFVARPA